MLCRFTGWSKTEAEELPWSEFCHCLDEAMALAAEEARQTGAAAGGLR